MLLVPTLILLCYFAKSNYHATCPKPSYYATCSESSYCATCSEYNYHTICSKSNYCAICSESNYCSNTIKRHRNSINYWIFNNYSSKLYLSFKFLKKIDYYWFLVDYETLNLLLCTCIIIRHHERSERSKFLAKKCDREPIKIYRSF